MLTAALLMTRAARNNLNDITLSHYHQAKNLLLIGSAEDDWYEGERCRRAVEGLLAIGQRVTRDDDERNQMRLREIREDLEGFARDLEEDAPEEIDERFVIYGDDESEDEDDEDDDEDIEDGEVTLPPDTGATISASEAAQPETHVTLPIRNQHERHDEEAKIGETSAAEPPRIHVEAPP